MPTIFGEVKEDMKIVKEEIFGPVVTIHSFSETEEVIEKSNDVIYGLGSSVWTKDINKAFKVANALRFGEVWIMITCHWYQKCLMVVLNKLDLVKIFQLIVLMNIQR